MKHYQVHAKVKGKTAYQEAPSVQVKANSPEEASGIAKDMLKGHPILNEHFNTDDVQAVEQPDDE